MYSRVLLKLSGEALSNEHECFDTTMLEKISLEIKELSQKVKVAIVVGGGNFVRGRTLSQLGVDRITADYMGMMGTVMNALALEASLKKINVKAKSFSAIDVETCEKYDAFKSRAILDDGGVVIFGGGIASPYFSTDTTSALRAIENNCEVILLAKNGTDGVYNDDPRFNKEAKKYAKISYDEILEKNLQVIDQTAASMCKDHGIKAIVFDMKEKGNILKACQGEDIGTLIF